MAKKKIKEEKVVLERTYIIPLRKSWLKVPKYKRANRAIKAIKQFIAKHMKVTERDLKMVKIDRWLNNEIWFRGIKKPPAKIKVKAKKYSDKVTVELAEIPKIIRFKIAREKRVKEKAKAKEKKKKKPAEEAKEKPKEEEKKEEEKVEEKEKKAAVVEAGLKKAEKAAREVKHEVAGKKIKIQRKALKK